MLIDGEAYYRAVADAIERAERTIRIVGWDMDSQVRLRRDGDDPGFGRFLARVIEERPGLEAWLLNWDWPVVYAFERELFPTWRFSWGAPGRLHFRLDREHPIGGSHHQKIVVVDDRVAFCGGLDITACRWDTPAHRAEDPRRLDPRVGRYDPFHDVQMIVEGPVAAALGELVAGRWKRATGESLAPAGPVEGDPWPPAVVPDVEDVTVAISRTDPRLGPVREIEQLHLDLIERARGWIFLENQYFTAHRIVEALARSLERAEGPEIVMTTPVRCSGWLEEVAMGVSRSRHVRRLREADRHDRFSVYTPLRSDLGSRLLNVHSKVVLADDRFVRVGSANLSNRSMGLDTECDLALELPAGKGDVAGRLRDRLLAEHLGAGPEEVGRAIRAGGSIRAAIESLRGGERTLDPFDPGEPDWSEEIVPEEHLLDPERPAAAEAFLDDIFGTGRATT